MIEKVEFFACKVCVTYHGILYWCVCTGQHYNPQTHFTDWGVPPDHVTQHGCPVPPMNPYQSTPTPLYAAGYNYPPTALGGTCVCIIIKLNLPRHNSLIHDVCTCISNGRKPVL